MVERVVERVGDHMCRVQSLTYTGKGSQIGPKRAAAETEWN